MLLWEALAGEHPFWRPSLVESARAIEAGAPTLRTLRPDLPRPLAAVRRPRSLPGSSQAAARRPARARVARAEAAPARAGPAERAGLDADPARPPRARGVRRSGGRARGGCPALLPGGLAAGGGGPRRPGRPGARAPGPAGRAGGARAAARELLPRRRARLRGGRARLARRLRARAARRPAAGRRAAARRGGRRGTATARRRRARALGVASRARGRRRRGDGRGRRRVARRAVAADGDLPPAELGLAGAERARVVAATLRDAATAEPALLAAGLVLGAAAALLPAARARGPWWIAAWGAGRSLAALVPVPGVDVLPLAVCIGATCALVWLEPTSARRPGTQGRALDWPRGGNPPPDRAPHHRAEDRVALRGRFRPRVPDARAASRACPQTGQGDGRAPHHLGVAHLRAQRVLRLPLDRRPGPVRRLRGRRCARSWRATRPSTPGGRATRCSRPHG